MYISQTSAKTEQNEKIKLNTWMKTDCCLTTAVVVELNSRPAFISWLNKPECKNLFFLKYNLQLKPFKYLNRKHFPNLNIYAKEMEEEDEEEKSVMLLL